ncbi:PLP-dependent cysteine synthase family protein [Desertivirga arenae]|uniref:PLP-dependent cysteine synthase family protein n=1 Tax=Desertivirga arenae TaxID=2810309 RepID=UPI001A979977|nr:PLP-dependent cysteine synthase family protein [Pedobacter sp. SYSU D00823]
MISTEESTCLSVDLDKKFKSLWHLVGNTPMLELQYMYKNRPGSIFVKCEHYNLTGSVKDRMALHILYQAYRNCKIKPTDRIVETTSGNTGISFAALGKALGHEVTIIMPEWLSQERIDIMRSLGAEVILVGKEEGGFLGGIKLSYEMAASGRVFLPEQFNNYFNSEAHELTTGREIWEQLESAGKTCDAFVAGVGTGGTIMGVGRYLKKRDAGIWVHPLEPEESPTLTTGFKVGSHRIQGISDEFIPSIMQLNQLNSIIQASDGDSILMAQKLSEQLGLAVGISSGANVIGAIKIREELGRKSNVVTILCDSNKKYLSTDLTKKEPVKEHYISPLVTFTGYEPMPRLNRMSFYQ